MGARGKGRLGAATAALAAAGALAMGATGSVSTPTVKSANNASLGTILVAATGRTLYHYADDHGTVVKCNGSCAAQWPPLLIAANAKPVAGPGIKAAKLGTVKRPDGKTQVTYNGYALYRFAGDTKSGQVNGQGLEKEWYAVSPSGAVIKLMPSATTSSAGSSGGSSSSSSSGGSSSSSSSGGSGDYSSY